MGTQRKSGRVAKRILTISLAASFTAIIGLHQNAMAVVTGVSGLLDYSETAIASGTLNGRAFTSAQLTIDAVGSPAFVTNPSARLYTLILSNPVTVSVVGVGSDNFTDLIQLFDNQTEGYGGGIIGFGDNTLNQDIFSSSNVPAYATYDLTTAFSSTAGVSYSFPTYFPTTKGSLQITSIYPFVVNFAATVVVPEPHVTAVVSLVFLCLLGSRRQRITGRPAFSARRWGGDESLIERPLVAALQGLVSTQSKLDAFTQ